MNCNQVNRQLSAYLDRELSGDEMLSVREHVNECAECSVELEQLKRVKSLLSHSKAVRPDPSVYSRMKNAIHGPRYTRAQRQRGWGLMALTACASALGVAMVFAQAEDRKSDEGTRVAETSAQFAESRDEAVAGVQESGIQMYSVKY